MLQEHILIQLNGFIVSKLSKVAVYGLKLNAQAVYWHFPDKIACFLDRDVQSGSFCGLPIMRLEELPQHGVQTVVIAASLQAEPHIYERIHNFCENHGIVIYGLYSGRLVGEHLGKALSTDKDMENVLRREIDVHDVISFDIFDTLLMRKAIYPTDVFDIVGLRLQHRGIDVADFKNYRVQAERGDNPHKGLTGIYQTLRNMLGWTEAQAEFAMREELKVERQVLLPRPGMAEILSYAHDIGKQILLVSDMYLPREFLQEVLAEHGLACYDGLYVSDDRGTGKGEQLFELVKEEHPAKSYLHIGDNAIVDGWSARVHGLDSWLLPSGLQSLRNTDAREKLPFVEDFNSRLIFGLFTAKAYGNPFGSAQVTDVTQFARLFMAPLAAQYILWLLQKAKAHNFEAVLFAARDGWLFRRLYDEAVEVMGLKDIPKGRYFYCSRKLCISAALQDEKSLDWMRGILTGQTHHFLREVFGFVPKDGHEPPVWGENPDLIWDEVLDQKESIFAKSAAIRQGYECYIAEQGLQREGHYAFADLCSQGTTQCALTHSVLPNLYGLIFARYMSGRSATMGRMETFLPQVDWHMLANNVFEFIFSSPEPSAASVDTDGNIIFEEEDRSEYELELIKNSQEEIVDFCREFFLLCDPDGEINPAVGQFLLSMYQKKTFAGAGKVFDNLDMHDNLMGGRVDCLLNNEK
ncbi:MAG: hypothetical protein E7200_07335 [Selenomonas ruminantium]|nr:hypothetical protein [Selenomonas ruminantium]